MRIYLLQFPEKLGTTKFSAENTFSHTSYKDGIHDVDAFNYKIEYKYFYMKKWMYKELIRNGNYKHIM